MFKIAQPTLYKEKIPLQIDKGIHLISITSDFYNATKSPAISLDGKSDFPIK